MAADESAHDGKVLSIAGGKLVMKSKNGTEHSYTLAVNPQISYDNAACKLEDLRAGMIVRVTAKKDNPQAATRIEAVNHYGAFMAEYEEREPQSLPTSPPRKPSTEKQASPDPPEESQPPAIQAEQLFHRMEEKLAKAKTLECVFEMKSPRSGSVGVFSTEGALFLGEENRARLEIYEATKERPLQQLWVSNGARRSMQTDANAQPHLQNTPDNLNRAYLTWLARLGLLATQGPVPVTDEKDFFTVSNFKLGNREKIGERETQRIEYQLSIKGQNEPISFTLWLDLKTGLPVKRTGGIGLPPGMFVTETYLKLKLDEKVDPQKFELPK